MALPDVMARQAVAKVEQNEKPSEEHMSCTEIETTKKTESKTQSMPGQSMIATKEKTPQRRSLLQRLRDLKDSRGSGTIEKIFIIALFIFVAAAGLKILGSKTKEALTKQGEGIEKTGQTAAPN